MVRERGVRRPSTDGWVLLSYRMPREPSSPRIAVWRKLERLGVARLGDGLVGLPADARTREQIEWIADEVAESGGVATVWIAGPSSDATEREIVQTMRAARAAEYQSILDEAMSVGTADDPSRVARRLRDELRRIERRDFFPPPERDAAHAAVAALTGAGDAPGVGQRRRAP